jgi:hypothetical protein
VADDIDGLIAQVIVAYDKFCPPKIDFGFLTLHSCLDQILASNGSNVYSIPIWGRRNSLEQELFHFAFLQVLLPSVLQGRYSVLNATTTTTTTGRVFRVSFWLLLDTTASSLHHGFFLTPRRNT